MDYTFDINPIFLSQFEPIGLRHEVDRIRIDITRLAAANQGIERITLSGRLQDKIINGIIVEARDFANDDIQELGRFLRVFFNFVLDESGSEKLGIAGNGFDLGRGANGIQPYMKWVIPPQVYTTTNTYLDIERFEKLSVYKLLRNKDVYIQWDDTNLLEDDKISLYVTIDYYVGTLKEGLDL